MNNCKTNFGFKHKSGILMPVSALPSRYGIGSFGKGAFDFIDFLDDVGQKCWQVLPLNPTSYGDSPYQSPASVAGNPYFIDLDTLASKGLITAFELKTAVSDDKRIDYGKLFGTRYPLLRIAYSRYKPDKKFSAFCRRNSDWLEDYALFMALKVHYGYRQWTLWDDEHRDVKRARNSADDFKAECGFWKWVQYEFFDEWQTIKEYAHSKNIVIIGDMPIYVAHDSMDVWRAPGQFLLDENYNPTVVAGCPPDAYAEDGQLWGNPIYNWELMKNDGFRWWTDRIRRSFELYDLLRIDHFRGFAGYFTIPYGDTTARGGHWNVGPGGDLFDAIRQKFPKAKIIAEDLGFITDDVRELLSYTDFPGMKVLQFAFYDENSEYLPRMYKTENCIVYTSSHDSDCTVSWYKGLSKEAKQRFKRECPRLNGESATYAAIGMAMGSIANLAVISMQDYLELTNDKGRINVPSVAEGNWSWRISPRYSTEKLKSKIKAVTTRYGREK